jgi:hypothetical protein
MSSLDPQNNTGWPTAYIQLFWDFDGPDRDGTWGSFLDLIEN